MGKEGEGKKRERRGREGKKAGTPTFCMKVMPLYLGHTKNTDDDVQQVVWHSDSLNS